jgi:hypothetical protein
VVRCSPGPTPIGPGLRTLCVKLSYVECAEAPCLIHSTDPYVGTSPEHKVRQGLVARILSPLLSAVGTTLDSKSLAQGQIRWIVCPTGLGQHQVVWVVNMVNTKNVADLVCKNCSR